MQLNARQKKTGRKLFAFCMLELCWLERITVPINVVCEAL
jgi:hypothetical protein